ncbi:MAG: ATP-dependent Clp protease ATP-binding subunit [Oscillospiraceae bacterium]|jgi:ATP-dependent Clp protease ATP-binding subunit ClpA|nr:ATP-dependent Clp protease ATP-binding subunit [Oscillospiraceae bacterium]
MQPAICSRCKENVAVVFLTKLENGKTSSEGLCLRCARELGIQPMNDLIKRMGISDDELDALTKDMTEALNNPQELLGLAAIDGDDSGDEEEDGKTATFPFINKLFSMQPHEQPENPPPTRPGRDPERRENSAPKRKFLENYCISLTQKAKEGKLDRIVGRASEIERVVQILNRRQKNNPCLIGEPGVGKTAIAEGLAQRIVDGAAPMKLLSKEVYLLDLTALVAGTQFRGQFESRMKGLIEEIRRLGNIILVIDEVHNLVGAGDAEGSMNAANILKPALSRGEIQVIGATTFSEYRKHIEKDAALERRFQTVTVAEPSIAESEEIIAGIAHYYEQFHGVRIPREVARQAVALSERYITDRFLPDKAIDLIDEACSDLNLKSTVIQQGDALRGKIDKVRGEREALMNAADNSSYARLAELKSEELVLVGKLEEVMKDGAPELSVENLANVIEQWTKIPASKIREQEFQRLEQLENRLKSRLIGQDKAVAAVAAAIKRNRVGISPKQKPVSFIFTGPTGVGKTELVKLLAQDLFDTPESLIRLDMSEFMEKHAVSRIIGSPPGYVGYDEAGQLTEKIRRRPYSVVLFDEIEKAHPDVLNVLLQILDDGHITDAHGRRVNFENTIVIMTSNAGSGDKASGAVGFNRTLTEMSRERAMKALSDIMRPEFINRVDEIVAFRALEKVDFAAICGIMLGDLSAVLEKRGMTLKYGGDVTEYLVDKSYSLKYGARNLRRLIQKDIEDPLAAEMVRNYNSSPTVVHLSAAKDEKGEAKIEIRLL